MKYTIFVISLLFWGCTEPDSVKELKDFERIAVESSTYDLNDLPDDIEEILADYVDSQCNSSGDYVQLLGCSGTKENRKLTYIGVYEFYSKPIKYWSFPCTYWSGCWAVVHPFDDNYVMGIKTEDPNNVK